MDDKREYHRIKSAKWRAANREKHRASVRAWRAANPEKARENDRRTRERRTAKERAIREAKHALSAEERALAKIARTEKKRVTARARYLANAEHMREQSRVWRLANPGRSAVLQQAWREKNREKVRANKRARKATKRATVIRELTKLQKGRCAYCRGKLGADFHVDHVMPLKLGGPDKRSNLQLACAPCNLSKSDRHPIEYAKSIGRLL